MAKSPDAFRTISEVAAWLGVQAHVLRFWESKFTQVKPVKRAGGRRYYRPADMRLIGGIKVLLHDEGMTIKGVQKVLREQGVAHVSALAPPLDGEAVDVPAPATAPAEKGGTVLAFKAKAEPAEKPGAAEKPAEKPGEQPSAAAREAAKESGKEAASAPASLPSFLNSKPEKPSQPPAPAPRPAASAAPAEPEPPYTPGALGHLAGLTALTARQAAEIAPLTRALRAWYERSEKAGQG